MNFSNSIDWWTTTKAAPRMFKPSNLTPEIEAYLRGAVGVDPDIISADLHISAPQVRSHQRKLGLRKITGNVRKGER